MGQDHRRQKRVKAREFRQVGAAVKDYLKSLLGSERYDDDEAEPSTNATEDSVRTVRAQARSYVTGGQPLVAASLLAEARLHGDAGQLLKTLGMAKEAARQFVKAGAWDSAEACFWMAGDHRNAARCAVKLGKFAKAAETFERLGERPLAAECRAKSGDWRDAARLYFEAGRYQECTSCYLELLRRNEAVLLELGDDEIRHMIVAQGGAPLEKALIHAIEEREMLPQLIETLLENDRTRLAVELYLTKKPKIGGPFLAWAGASPDNGEKALKFAKASNDLPLTARLYEQMNRGDEAVEVYRQAGDLESAYALCLKYEKWDLLATLKSSMGSAPAKDRPKAKPAAAVAVLSKVEAFSLESLAIEMKGIGEEERPQPTAVFLESRFFKNLKEADRRTLWQMGTVKKFRAGDLLVDFDEAPIGTFTLLGGSASIIRRSGGRDAVVDEIQSGCNFGESWLLANLRSEVRVVASSDCLVHVIDKSKLSSAIETGTHGSPSLVRDLAEILVTHLFAYMKPRSSPAKVFAFEA